MKSIIKIIVKIIISKLPVPYSFWKLIGLFKHGKMDSCEYAIKIFNLHYLRAFKKHEKRNITILELGPGDSIASALIGFSYGASNIFLIDVDNFASKNINFYKKLSEKLRSLKLTPPNLEKAKSIKDILNSTNSIYLTNGLDSLRSIKSNSVDFIWSHSVLEHIRKKDFLDVQIELKRILKPEGYISHNIDFQDHLDHGLNNLRFSEKLWESELFRKGGFYTNRIPAKAMHSLFRKVGFTIISESFGKWPKLPNSRKNMDKEFNIYSDLELINRTSNVLLQK